MPVALRSGPVVSQPAPVAVSPFVGTWTLTHEGTTTQAVIQVSGTRLSGVVTEPNLTMNLAGQVQGAQFTGTLSVGGQSLPAQGQVAGDQLTVAIGIAPNQQTFVMTRQAATGGQTNQAAGGAGAQKRAINA